MSTYKYKSAFSASLPARDYGNKGLMLYALALKFDIDDIVSLASTSLTDNKGDKGLDVLHFIPEQKTAIVIQGYMSKDETKPEAKSSKAAKFSNAITWALSMPLEKVPEPIRVNVGELRNAIDEGEVENFEFWYVHNLDESKNVKDELEAAAATAKSLLSTHFSGKKVTINPLEVGNQTLEKWYNTRTQTIIVDDDLEAEVEYGGYKIKAEHWVAFQTTVSLKWLKELFKKYGDDLFSANIRGFMGNVEINNSIMGTCNEEPDNFWIYNNGITCLVHAFEYNEKEKKIRIKGISIINGAQTTGAVGSSDILKGDGYLPIRFITSDKSKIWYNTVLFNNSQNRIYSYDFRSNDEVQKRLREEFKSIPETEYEGRRGGFEDIVRRRRPNLLGTEKAAISLVAFHEDPYLTYHKKREIWSDSNYRKYYNENLSAKHLVFTYSLLHAIEKKKSELRKNYDKLTTLEQEEYEFLKKRGGMRLYLSAIGYSIEEILGEKIPDARKLSFDNKSWKEASEYWKDVVTKTIMYCNKLRPGIDNGILNPEYVPSSLSDFKRDIASQVASVESIFKDFRERVKKQ